MDDHLLKLPRFIGLSRRTSQVLSQNVSLAWHQGSIVPIGTGGKGNALDGDVAHMFAGAVCDLQLLRQAGAVALRHDIFWYKK